MRGRGLLVATAVGAAVLGPAGPADSHPLSPALLALRESSPGVYEVRWKTSSMRAPGSDLQPDLPASCRSVTAVAVTTESDDELLRTWTVDCGPDGLIGERVGLRDLTAARIDGLIRIEFLDGRTIRAVVRSAQPTIEVAAAATAFEVARDYLRLGLEHILTGPDHLLFVFGLLMLVRGVALLIKTITAFTIGHSITLSAAALGWVRFPADWMEVGIALSVFLLAVELSRPARSEATRMQRWPWAVAGGFGLLHGLGFAGALAEVGLPHNEIPAALLSFNIGIELGQLAFVAAVLPLRSALRRVRSVPRWLQLVPVYAMGSLAAFWCFERLATALAA